MRLTQVESERNRKQILIEAMERLLKSLAEYLRNAEFLEAI